MAHAPVFLVADIQSGRSLRLLVGTLGSLDKDERDMVARADNKQVRGDLSLFEPGVEFLEKKTGKPVLGVVP